MSLSRRALLKLAAMSGAAFLPNVSGVLGADQRAAAVKTAVAPGRERLLADFGWRFALGHANDPVKDFGFGRNEMFAKSGSFLQGGRGTPAPTSAAFDDKAWVAVNLPHDWAVDLPFVSDAAVNAQGAKPLGRSYPETSIGWYRRTFDIPATDNGRRISIAFDGVFRDAIVMLNGHYIGRNLSGYAPFHFDVTDFVTYGGRNTLVVRADATEHEGWFYEGAGIYRHVWLEKTSPLHVAREGTFVTTSVTGRAATLTIETEVANDADASAAAHVVSRIVDAKGATIATASAIPQAIPAWSSRTFKQQVTIASPSLWSIETPHLYRLISTVESAKGETDRYETPFGIRTIHFDADKGLFLNGAPIKIQGMCNHQDHAGVGSALPDRLQAFRIEKLKSMGVNAYRTSHNPPTPELLDACDRLGMLVLDETRMMSSNDEGLSQLERLVRRDRNHPSVFCWSIGNEEPEQGTERGAREAETMKRVVKRLDPSRSITEAMNSVNSWGHGLSAVVDVQGFNYGHAPNFDAFHKQFPKQPTMGTEVASTVSTRGIYVNDKAKGYVSAYDRNFPGWASTAEEWWTTYHERPWVAGGFVWTGFDYRGEPTPYGWPCISSHFGILDTCGFPKDLYYYYQAWWTSKPVLHLFPHWNWQGATEPIEVWCFTNLDRVELFLNGISVGVREVKPDSHVSWSVPFAAGTLEARGYKGAATRPVLVERRETTGEATQIVLAVDRSVIAADGEDVANVEVRIADTEGRIVPTAAHPVTFTIEGPGAIIGVGNGDPSSHEPDHATARSAFNGLCLAIVQSAFEAGAITVRAASPGLIGATATIAATKAERRQFV
jgi:beta-galactosidase